MEYLYLIKSFGEENQSILKFGFTKTIKKRIETYRTNNPYCKILYIAKLNNAYELEQYFHNNFESLVGREWYTTELESSIITYINNYQHIKCNVIFLNPFLVNVTDGELIESQLIDVPTNKLIGSSIKENIDNLKNNVNPKLIYKKYPDIKEAVFYLGIDKLIELNYNMTNIKRYVNIAKNTGNHNIIKEELKKHYKITDGVFVNLKDLKQIFQQAYKNLDIKLVGKAVDVEKYFKVKKTVKQYSVPDATWNEHGYNILSVR